VNPLAPMINIFLMIFYKMYRAVVLEYLQIRKSLF
jgi:hypothetical protein